MAFAVPIPCANHKPTPKPVSTKPRMQAAQTKTKTAPPRTFTTIKHATHESCTPKLPIKTTTTTTTSTCTSANKKSTTGGIKALETPNHLSNLLKSKDTTPETVTVIKCYATYCRSCKGAEPKYRKIAAAYQQDPSIPVTFCQMDFAANETFCRDILRVNNLPFFAIFRGDEYLGGEAIGWQSVTKKLVDRIDTILPVPAPAAQ